MELVALRSENDPIIFGAAQLAENCVLLDLGDVLLRWDSSGSDLGVVRRGTPRSTPRYAEAEIKFNPK